MNPTSKISLEQAHRNATAGAIRDYNAFSGVLEQLQNADPRELDEVQYDERLLHVLGRDLRELLTTEGTDLQRQHAADILRELGRLYFSVHDRALDVVVDVMGKGISKWASINGDGFNDAPMIVIAAATEAE